MSGNVTTHEQMANPGEPRTMSAPLRTRTRAPVTVHLPGQAGGCIVSPPFTLTPRGGAAVKSRDVTGAASGTFSTVRTWGPTARQRREATRRFGLM